MLNNILFQIKQYLQYRNTPDDKPKVLVEGVDYNLKTVESLKKYLDFEYKDNGEVTLFEHETVASLSDCRPILTVEIDGGEWTELDIAVDKAQLKIIYMIEENGVYKMVGRKPDELWNDEDENFLYGCEKLGSFFDDLGKYSKLLWNCSEQEGWQKIFELLEIK